MSVPAVTSVASDALAQALLHTHPAPIQPDSHARRAVAPPPEPSEPPSAQSALDEFLNGEPPDNASIGLYSEAPRESHSGAPQDLAAQSRTEALAEQQVLARDVAPEARESGAVTEIARSLEHALAQAQDAELAANLQDLLQTVGAGASKEIAATMARLQSALLPAGAPSLAPMLASALASATGEPVATLAPIQTQPEVAASEALASVARAIQAELEATAPADWLTALASAIPAATNALPQVDPYANPLLLAFQLGVLIGVKTTLNKRAPVRGDRVVILPILGLGECELHEDGRDDA